VTASAIGADHSVTISAVTSAAFAAGIYSWQSYATKALERFLVGAGRLEVKPNLATVTTPTFEYRTEARQIYDQLVAAYRAYSLSRGGVQQYTIGTRSMTFANAGDFIRAIEYWRAQAEAADIAAGLARGPNVFIRFRNG
ncbi:MAG: hypothetical protein ACREWG_00635, partial [Gammaproteobacteria bacterium]